ncbi:MAG: hypothetical protein LBF93_07640 [Zoogloeaceae bacterium]|nr:hypothetical protein [Zoogloeaceae bacterium]
MTNTQAYLEALKARNGGISDYRASINLGVTRSTVSLWKSGRTSMSMSQAEKVAEALDLDPDIVILETQLDRCKSPEESAVWKRILKRLSSASAAALAALFLILPTPAPAAPASQPAQGICIM